MSYKPGDAYYAEFTTSNPTTGAAANADSLPVATPNRNGVDDGATFTLTATNIDTGRYKVTGTIPNTYAKGDVINVSVAATVATVAGKGVIDSFVLDSKRVGDLNDIAATDVVSGGAITTSGGKAAATVASGDAVDMAPIATGTAQAGGANTITLAAGASAVDDFYKDKWVRITGGTGVGEVHLIVSYAGATKVATIARGWATTPDATSTYAILPAAGVDVWAFKGTVSAGMPGFVGIDWSSINSPTTAQALTNTTIASGQSFVASNTVSANLVQINGVTATQDVNNLLNVNVKDWGGTAVGGMPNSTTPPTAAQIATAILTDTTAGDLGTSGSIGYIIAHQLAGTFTTTSSSVFTAAALANAPSGGGGSVTVAGYAAGQDPATLVLDALAASHDGAGTIGQKINAAGGAADPLTNAVPGAYASGTAGYVLGTYLDAAISSAVDEYIKARIYGAVTANADGSLDFKDVVDGTTVRVRIGPTSPVGGRTVTTFP